MGREREREGRWLRMLSGGGGGRAGRRRLPSRSLVLFGALIGALLLGCAPALALGQRGHVFGFSFGSPGSGEGQFVDPSGIAVEDSTGDVYVADHANNRVEEFRPALNTKGEPLLNEKGEPIENYARSLEVPAPGSVAVDNTATGPSAGDVYVVGDRQVLSSTELDEEATELKEEAAELKEEAKKLKEEAVALNKEAARLTGTEQKAKEEEAKAKEATAETLKGEEEERDAKAREDERAGPRARERAEEEAEEIKAEAADPEFFWVYKFNAAGTLIATFHGFHQRGETLEQTEEHLFTAEHPAEVAVDPSGSLFVDLASGEVYKLNDGAPKNASESIIHSGLTEEAKPGFAVDSNDNLYLGVVDAGSSEVEQEIANEYEHEHGTGEEFAVIAKLAGATGAVLDPALDFQYSTSVAVNPAEAAGNGVDEQNDVYINTLASVGGQDATTVAAFNPEGQLIQRFSVSGLEDGRGIAADAKTGAVYVSDAQADRVDVFTLEPPARPTVEGVSACTLGDPQSGCPAVLGATTLKARVDPTGSETSYHFEYGSGSCSSNPSPCQATAEQTIGGGFAEQEVSVELPSGLPTGVYHYRVVAKNTFGTSRSSEQTFTILAAAGALPDGRAWEMVSPPEKGGSEPETITNEGGVIQASENGRAITFVADGPMPVTPAPEGNRPVEFPQILSVRGSEGWSSRDIATPNETGSGFKAGAAGEYQFFSPTLALALVEPFPGAAKSGTLAEPPLSPPLSEQEVGKQEKTIYLRDDAGLEAQAQESESYSSAKQDGERMTPENPGYLALVTEVNEPGGEPFGGGVASGTNLGLEFEGATADLSHVVFRSHRAAPGLYEWGPKGSCKVPAVPLCTGEDVQPVSVLHGAPVGSEVTLGGPEAAGESHDVNHAISTDGSLVFWTSTSATSSTLYVRDTATQETLQLSTVQKGASGAGPSKPVFQTASADGSKVFFTDTQRLTPGSKAGNLNGNEGGEIRGYDLYVAELSGGGAPGSPLAYTLADLTPEGTSGETSGVAGSREETGGGGVLGASEDGSYVYFAASGVLASSKNAEGEEAARGDCAGEEAPARTACNLYVRHYNGTEWMPTKLVAVLSSEDMPDWGGVLFGERGDLGFMTSRVSPNGRYLAFMSDRSLTGYDNEDASAEAGGARDEEVFLFDASSERLVCASCNPTGARPAGVLDKEGPEGGKLLVDGPEIWEERGPSEPTDHWLAGSIPGWTQMGRQTALYQSRYLSNSGRLFFNSPDHLVPAATGTKEKVYEYEPNAVGSCDSEGGCVGLISSGASEQEAAFLDASATGNDVFFLTAEQLVQQDKDTLYDVYDAHVCEPSSAEPSSSCQEAASTGSPPCESEAQCRPGSTSQPAFQAPASTTPGASGSVSAQQQVLHEKVSAPPAKKAPTRAQKLASALKKCAKDRKKSKRQACEKQARKLYGPKKSTKGKKSSTRGSGR
jgi:DNA-binding beta-propeller fold protein YncE